MVISHFQNWFADKIIKKHLKKVSVRTLVILNFDISFNFYTRHVGSKYRLSVYLICNNRYQPWKTHIGRPHNEWMNDDIYHNQQVSSSMAIQQFMLSMSGWQTPLREVKAITAIKYFVINATPLVINFKTITVRVQIIFIVCLHIQINVFSSINGHQCWGVTSYM